MNDDSNDEPAIRPLLQSLQRAICDESPAQGGSPLLMMPCAPGLAIYREAYRARLAAALRDNYLVLHRAMGDEAFDALAGAYLQARPSRHASIRWFGDELADFMAGAHAGALPHPAMVDFARMDWALRGAFDGPDAPLLSMQALRELAPQDWPALVFRLHPSAEIVGLDWAIEPAWRALRAHEPDTGEPAPELAAPLESAHALLVWRQGLETRWRALEPLEAALLKALAEGRDFASICALAARHGGDEEAEEEEEAAATVVALLQRWLGDGLLARA